MNNNNQSTRASEFKKLENLTTESRAVRRRALEPLAPEMSEPVEATLQKSELTKFATWWSHARAFWESAKSQRARLFTACVNIHSQRVGPVKALDIAVQAATHLNVTLWRLRGGTGSFLNKRAEGQRALSLWVPGCGDSGLHHSHGLILVPRKLAGDTSVAALEDIMLSSPGENLRRHEGAVKLDPVVLPGDIPAISAYLAANVREVSDAAVHYAPWGRGVKQEWNGLFRRVDQLKQEKEVQAAWAAYRAAETTNLLRNLRWDEARLTSACSTGSVVAEDEIQGPELLPMPWRPDGRPDLPRDQPLTGVMDW